MSVTLAGASLMTGAVMAGTFIAIGPVIGAHIPSIPDFTQLLVGVGVIAIGRNPNGIGKLYTDVAYFLERRRAKAGLAILRRPDPVRPVSRLAATPAAVAVAHGKHPPNPSRRRCPPLADLVVSKVSVRFGGVHALRDVDLTVPAGTVQGLIGPNGAGKTTLFNVITGPSAAQQRRGLVLAGSDISSHAPHLRARLGIARTFQRLELFGTLTTRENIRMAAETQRRKLPANMTSGALADALLDRVGLTHVADEPADMLPTGLARLVELARALATAPSVLLLDEPSAGLNGDETDNLGRILQQLAGHGMGILLVEHDMSLVMGVCQNITVLDFGVVVAAGRSRHRAERTLPCRPPIWAMPSNRTARCTTNRSSRRMAPSPTSPPLGPPLSKDQLMLNGAFPPAAGTNGAASNGNGIGTHAVAARRFTRR